MSVLSTFRTLAPEFSVADYPDADVEDMIDLVTPRLDASVHGSRMTEAVALLVAHELALQARRAASGVGVSGVGGVTQMSAGDLSVSFAGLAQVRNVSDEYFRQTSHGLAYLQLRASRSGVGISVLR